MLAARLARMRVPLGFFCAGAVLWLARPTPRSLAIGGAIAVCGELVRIWAAGHLEKGREVTQSGPYRITRHPLYAGSAVIALGAAMASARVTAIVLIGAVHGSHARAQPSVTKKPACARHSATNTPLTLESRSDALLRVRSAWRALIKNKEHKAVAGLALVGAMLAAKAFLLQ